MIFIMTNSSKIRVFIALAALLVSACVTSPEHPTLKLVSKSEYESSVERGTQNVKIYDGFSNILNVTGTLLTTSILFAQIDQNARMYQWSEEQYGQEKAKAEASLAKESKLFISFFTPERKHDDLQKSSSHWKIFLDVDGRRFEGTATRWKSILVEVQALYSYHSRWGTPYLITFPVPMKQIESRDAKITITGPVGSAQLEFKARAD